MFNYIKYKFRFINYKFRFINYKENFKYFIFNGKNNRIHHKSYKDGYMINTKY